MSLFSSSPAAINSLLLGLLLSFSLASVLPSGPANGDIRLANNDSDLHHGVLHIYLDGQWGSVSYEGFTLSAANVACRQLGLIGANNFTSTGGQLSPNSEFGSGTSPVLLKDVRCHSNHSLHLLRCDSNTTTGMSHDHSNDVVLNCSQQTLKEHPFRGQLHLSGSNYSSQGLLNVFLNSQWGTVCGDYYKQADADSSCRQLGYTGATNFSDHAFGRGIIWIKDFYCNQSMPCLMDCYTSPTIRDISCRHSQDVELHCTFDRTMSFETSGNETTCEIVIVEVPMWITWLCFTIFLSLGLGYIVILVLRLSTAAYHNTSRYRAQNTHNTQEQNLVT